MWRDIWRDMWRDMRKVIGRRKRMERLVVASQISEDVLHITSPLR